MLKAQEWPWGWQMPGPQAVQNLQMPHPGGLGAAGID